MTIGDRIELTADVTALGHTHHQGDKGTIQGSDPDGYLTTRMDNGRTTFPHHTETKPA